jgi:hypothetical protein
MSSTVAEKFFYLVSFPSPASLIYEKPALPFVFAAFLTPATDSWPGC